MRTHKIGNVVVYTADRAMCESEHDRIKQQLTSLFPNNRIAVLDAGATIEVVNVERSRKRLSFRAILLARCRA